MLSNEEAFKRLAICNTCPELIKENWACSKCGCAMKIKARQEEASCPLDKW